MPAVICFEDYINLDELSVKLKKSQKGNWLRMVNKSISNGYYCEPFNKKQYIPDIYEINTSAEYRSGGAMPASYKKTIEQLGGAPRNVYKFSNPVCKYHWDIWFGVFRNQDGYAQGSVITNKRLYGYIHLRRQNDLLIYALFLGHKDFLNDGIMNLCHYKICQWVLQEGDSIVHGVKALMYGAMNHGGLGREEWKRRAGFNEMVIVME